jgi:hypothetical protein
MNETQNQQTQPPQLSQEEMLAIILENTRKTRSYIKWQLIITVAFVVLPLIATVLIIPVVLSAVNGAYGGAAGGLLQ